MKLFVGTCVLFCLIQLSVQQYHSNSHRWGFFGNVPRNVGDDSEDLSYGSLQKLSSQVGLDEPAKKNPAKDLPKSIGKQTSVKFVLKCGLGYVEKEEQIFITAGKKLPGKLQRVLAPTDGYITVVYRDYKGLLTRIEKLRLPKHLPKETIPDGGIVIDRTELPWEPSINPMEIEVTFKASYSSMQAEEENSAKPLNIENQNDDERPSSGRAEPEVSYDSPPRRVQQPDKTSSSQEPLKFLAYPPQDYYLRTDGAGRPLRQRPSWA